MSILEYDDNHQEMPVTYSTGSNGVTLSAVNKTRLVSITVDGASCELTWDELISFSNKLQAIQVGASHIIISENPYQTAPDIVAVGFESQPDPHGSVMELLKAAPTRYLSNVHWEEQQANEARIAELEVELEKAKRGANS